MADVLVAVVLGVVVAALGVATYRSVADPKARRQYRMTVQAIRWWTVPAAVLHIGAVVTLFLSLLAAVPFLRFGWWMLLGGSGNLALGQTGRTGMVWQAIAIGLPLWLLLLIPRLAVQEELGYRYGCEDDSRVGRFRRQVVFGLGHAAVMGVPIAAGIALIGSGLLYQLVYLRAARGLYANTELVEVASAPTKLAYPPVPTGQYDAAVWDAHHREFDCVAEQNRALVDQWVAARAEQREQRDAQVDGIRELAATKAAALHAVSNWLIVSLLIVWLALRFL